MKEKDTTSPSLKPSGLGCFLATLGERYINISLFMFRLTGNIRILSFRNPLCDSCPGIIFSAPSKNVLILLDQNSMYPQSWAQQISLSRSFNRLSRRCTWDWPLPQTPPGSSLRRRWNSSRNCVVIVSKKSACFWRPKAATFSVLSNFEGWRF